MREFVTELRVLDAKKNIFDTDVEYTIPLYQRAYAWEDKQLTQLVEDIADVPDNTKYYIGALIVSSQGGKFEVVDGQQRLTSLYLLLHCLGIDVKHTLTFACRDKSNYTLKKIKELLNESQDPLDKDRIEPTIQRGLKILTEELNKVSCSREELIRKLRNVVIYRIEVPENTDLNRYFEIMNTRGEQLEQHDILKAMLMSYLPDQTDKAAFAKIWDACSDMTGYVQMHFISRGNVERERLFGGEWRNMPPSDWSSYRKALHATESGTVNHSILDIIDPAFQTDIDNGYIDDDTRVRFESVIEYPFFLIHVLKVMIAIHGIHHIDQGSVIIPELLDDKKLVDNFSNVIRNGLSASGKVSEDKAQFSKDFAICLLRTRFLFDQFIIKREYANEDSDGEWSLKSLYVSGRESKKKPYYRNSRFRRFGEWDTTNNWRTKINIMIQSALRVSYTSPKVMHWITQLLQWLSENEYQHTVTAPDDMASYQDVEEVLAKKAVITNFFEACPDGRYAMGVNTPHIVFNYLDFLLWKGNQNKYQDFSFEFRNSVEHWYPQNPSEGTFEPWKDGVDQFGNLCIIQRNVNSKFSNMSPEAKKSTFKEMISKGSLKLRIMSDLTEKKAGQPASLAWREFIYKQHEDEMLALLREACYPGSVSNA